MTLAFETSKGGDPWGESPSTHVGPLHRRAASAPAEHRSIPEVLLAEAEPAPDDPIRSLFRALGKAFEKLNPDKPVRAEAKPAAAGKAAAEQPRAAYADPPAPVRPLQLACPSARDGSVASPVRPVASPGRVGKQLPPIVVNTLGNQPRLVDANPLFFGGRPAAVEGAYPRLAGPTRIDVLSFSQLIALEVPRSGVAADGVSRLAVVLRAPTRGRFTTSLKADNESGSLQFVNDGATCEVGGKHLAVALYTAPRLFGDGSGMRDPGERAGAVAEARRQIVPLGFQDSSGGAERPWAPLAIRIVRPPVVLVHGTFDDGEQAWLTPAVYEGAPLSDAFATTLQQKGFVTFVVDYRQSNGSAQSKHSSFRDNRMVVWYGGPNNSWFTDGPTLSQQDKPPPGWTGSAQTRYPYVGGIRQALDHYRERLDVAVARADVIGHSMGGLLARVYASPDYNDQYRRPDNFGAGDINRLITLSTPHHGSELPEVLRYLTDPNRANHSVLSSLASRGFTEGAWWLGVADKQGALLDQIPGSKALRAIGSTEVPSHLVVTVTRPGGLVDRAVDASDSVFTRARIFAAMFTYFPENLDGYFDLIEPDWRAHPVEGQPFTTLRRDFEYLIWNEWAHHDWVKATFAPSWLTEGKVPGPEVLMPVTIVEAMRRLVFRFDDNDTTVRVDSQRGSLPLDSPFVSRFENLRGATKEISVIHGSAPRYQPLQLKVVKLLKSGEGVYAESLPPAGQLQPPHRAETLESTPVLVTGSHAKAWSGMVFDHADAFLDVAQRENVVIMGRPVNPDATALILDNAATKGMSVKGKSSNWGPQKGFLPRNQRYSKLWRTVSDPARRAARIEEFNAKTESMLKAEKPDYRLNGEPIAIARPLVHAWPRCAGTRDPACQQRQTRYSAWVLPDEKEPDAEQAILLCRGEPPASNPCGCEAWFDWRTAANAADGFDFDTPPSRPATPRECGALQPLEVIADNTHPDKPYLTADYDLLTTGFFCPQGPGSQSPHCRALVKVEDPALPKPERCSRSARFVEARYGKGESPEPPPCFDPNTGLITAAQSYLIDRLNAAVQAKGYAGGKVSHHGPETQFFESPYVDYPITVFDPAWEDNGTTRPEIISIPKGPKGFRDLHLKRYYERKIVQGFWLYPNKDQRANWHWRPRAPGSEWSGYQYYDDPRVPRGDDVEEIPPPTCVRREIERQLALRRGERAPAATPCQQARNEEGSQ